MAKIKQKGAADTFYYFMILSKLSKRRVYSDWLAFLNPKYDSFKYKIKSYFDSSISLHIVIQMLFNILAKRILEKV